MDVRIVISLCLLSAIIPTRADFENEMKEAIRDIIDRLAVKEDRINLLEDLVLLQENRIKDLEDNVDEQKEKVAKLESEKVSALGSLLGPSRRQLSSETDSPIAFTALLTDHIEHAGELQNIPFDFIVTNEGNAYTSHSGIFKAPAAGLYIFSSTVVSYPHNNARFSFIKNGHAVSHMHPHSTPDSPAYDTSSMTIILKLAEGDDISVANRQADDMLNGGRQSSFSGFLLYQYFDEAEAIVGK